MALSMGLLGAASPPPPPLSDTYDLLETQILSGAAASVTFSSLETYASIYDHLQLRHDSDGYTTYGSFQMRINGDATASNYRYHHFYAGGGAPTGDSGAAPLINYQWVAGPSSQVIDLHDAFSPSKFKTSKSFNGNTIAGAGMVSVMTHLWKNTAAIDSITILNERQNLPSGSRFSLYGLGKVIS
jgi:hypothetical protein